ncbi:MAG: tyrosine-type recombinase/integrase [Methylocystis sp.]|uniref:tyrosine-type recombinase/integrase n=1 Tax=Methylocystis sp. TaxID=1911079 RepID=UPI003DA3A38D
MALTKQAKTLSKAQINAVQSFLQKTRHPLRNRLIFLLSVKAGLRAKEIACLTWDMVTDAGGNLSDAIHLTDLAAKGNSGRVIPMSKDLQVAFAAVKREADNAVRPSAFVITTERAGRTSSYTIVNMFADWYRALGFTGASSHSGRRTFITNAARKISTVGGSLRDVQLLAGHTALSTTQRYIEADGLAQRRIVDLV